MMDHTHFSEFLLRQQMLHAASMGGLHRPPVEPDPPNCEVRLLNGDLWRRFHELGTEMIITKGGRRMFPSLRVSLSNLDPNEEYCVLLELALVGRRRLRWAGGSWAAAGGAEPQSARRVVLHPDSPATGAHWTANPVSFGKVKLTNNTMDTQGHMVLTSMHKYRPRVIVVRARDAAALAWGAPHSAFSFPETEFIAVTAYQNDRITKLKIDNNPFAKGFRACGQSKCKRKVQEPENQNNNESKRQCSDAISSCSDDTSLRSASPDSSQQQQSPSRLNSVSPRQNIANSPSPQLHHRRSLSPPNDSPPPPMVAHLPSHLPPMMATPSLSPPQHTSYHEMAYNMAASWPAVFPPVWMTNCFFPRPHHAVTVPQPQPPCKKVKSFTIRSILGES